MSKLDIGVGDEFLTYGTDTSLQIVNALFGLRANRSCLSSRGYGQLPLLTLERLQLGEQIVMHLCSQRVARTSCLCQS